MAVWALFNRPFPQKVVSISQRSIFCSQESFHCSILLWIHFLPSIPGRAQSSGATPRCGGIFFFAPQINISRFVGPSVIHQRETMYLRNSSRWYWVWIFSPSSRPSAAARYRSLGSGIILGKRESLCCKYGRWKPWLTGVWQCGVKGEQRRLKMTFR